MQTYIVSYDISDKKRLRRVAKCCEDFGERRQLSVFMMRLSALNLVRLRARLHDVIDHRADQVLFVPLSEKHALAIEAMGRATPAADERDVVIVL